MPRKLSYNGSAGERLFGQTFSRAPDFRNLGAEIPEEGVIYFEIPLITEKFHDEAYDFVKSLLPRHDVTVIANDYGTLLFCAGLKTSGTRITIVAGRLLGYQYSCIPWVEEIIKAESASVRQAFLGNYFDSKEKAEVLREYGVSGIYCNYSEHTDPVDNIAALESIARVRNMGFEIYLNISENILAVNPFADNAKDLHSTGITLIDKKLTDIYIFDGMVTQKRTLRDSSFADVLVV